MKQVMLMLLPVLTLVTGLVDAAADRSQPPTPGEARPLTLPDAHVHRFANGLTLHLLEMHEVPVVEIALVARQAGAANDPPGADGTALMVADMLDEGAGERDALEIADALGFLGASLDVDATWDAATVRLRAPVARLDQALPVFTDVVLRPRFTQDDLDRLRTQALTALLQARDEPRQIASRAVNQAVFGTEHRYGRPQGGDAASLASMSSAELAAFHRVHYAPESSVLVVVGDVTLGEVLPMIRATFGDWTGTLAEVGSQVGPPPTTPGRRVLLIDKPEAAQSVLRFASTGPDWSEPAYHATQVMNTLLGGSFTSRLNDNLRERNGYTYGAFSRFWRYGEGGLFTAAADVQTDKTAPAVHEMLYELERISTPAATQEVERARNYTAFGYAGTFETTQQVAQRVVEQVTYDLPGDLFTRYVPSVLEVGAEDVSDAAKRYISTANGVLVIVGDRSVIEAPLSDLALGDITHLTITDVMGEAPSLSETPIR